MRLIHYYADGLRPSGVTAAIARWQRAQIEFGVDSVLWTDSSSKGPARDLPTAYVRHVGKGRATRIPLFERSRFSPSDVLILHEGWTAANLAASHQVSRLGVPTVLVPHGAYDPRIMVGLKAPVFLRKRAEKSVISRSIVHNFVESEREFVLQLQRPRGFVTAPTGVQQSDAGAPWRGGGNYVAWFGRYSPHHKGIDRLLAAHATQHPESRLPLKLRGPDHLGGKARVEALVSALDLKDVEVGGAVDGTAKDDFLSRCSAVVFPSRWESFSIAVLECFVRGVPVLADCNLAMMDEAVSFNACEIADFSRPLSAGQAMQAVSADVGRRGLEYAERRLSWAAILPEYFGALRSQLEQGKW